MTETRPYKDRPWIIFKEPGYLGSLLGIGGHFELDTSHPEWIKQVLIPTIEKCKKIKMI